MEKLEIKGIIFKDYYENGDEIAIKASWVAGNKATVNFHWLFYGDGTSDRILLSATKKDGKAFTGKEIEEQASTIIEAIKRDCLDEWLEAMTE